MNDHAVTNFWASRNSWIFAIASSSLALARALAATLAHHAHQRIHIQTAWATATSLASLLGVVLEPTLSPFNPLVAFGRARRGAEHLGLIKQLLWCRFWCGLNFFLQHLIALGNGLGEGQLSLFGHRSVCLPEPRIGDLGDGACNELDVSVEGLSQALQLNYHASNVVFRIFVDGLSTNKTRSLAPILALLQSLGHEFHYLRV
mmetsp:Transcript_16057/g.40229  ORF Transcript_16057/g.40229 Transcript_16057/m.40229 type:complete len:203 (+) Transcript_16057:222-830(+)